MKKYYLSIYLLLSIFFSPVVWATSVLPLSLEQLSTKASLIYYAEVISNQTKVDEQSGRIATFTEFRIIDLIKGTSEITHTIKQIGGTDPNSQSRLHIHGVPTFQVGKNYVVFLPVASELGFCSPLGLSQGSYMVSNINGESVVSNGKNLTASSSIRSSVIQVPLATNTNYPSQAGLADFINTVRAYNTN